MKSLAGMVRERWGWERVGCKVYRPFLHSAGTVPCPHPSAVDTEKTKTWSTTLGNS